MSPPSEPPLTVPPPLPIPSPPTYVILIRYTILLLLTSSLSYHALIHLYQLSPSIPIPIGFLSWYPIFILMILVWYQHFFNPGTRRLYGLFRMHLFVLFVGCWPVFIYHCISHYLLQLDETSTFFIRWLSPYVTLAVSLLRLSHHVSANSWRVHYIHFFYDVPALCVIYLFSFFSHPLNSLYTPIVSPDTHPSYSGIYLGSIPFSHNISSLKAAGVGAVVNLCGEWSGCVREYKKEGMEQLWLPTMDMSSPQIHQVEKALEFIKEQEERGKKVFVHCKMGAGRSATIVLCHLIWNKGMEANHALQQVKKLRPEIAVDILKYPVVREIIAREKKKREKLNGQHTQ